MNDLHSKIIVLKNGIPVVLVLLLQHVLYHASYIYFSIFITSVKLLSFNVLSRIKLCNVMQAVIMCTFA
jgi:hypothetical protein